MSLNVRLQKVLADEFMWYRIQPYHDAVDAQHVAAAAHVTGDGVAKTVMLRDGDGAFLMLVLPASCSLDLAAVQQSTGRPALRLAREGEFAPLFPDCSVGAMPPFGSLYGLPLLADACLLDAPEILFRGGNHDTLVRVRSEDWVSVAQPIVGVWCRRHRHTAA
jgi:Ala-tRNA(Pro) deacylase